MRSAIRWYEDAVTGKLGRLPMQEALDQSVRESRDRSKLPAGLWTLSRNGLAGLTARSGVPIGLSKAGMPPGESPDDPGGHTGLPELLAAGLGKAPGRAILPPAVLRPLQRIAVARAPEAQRGAVSARRGGAVQQPGQKSPVMAVPMIADQRATAASPSSVPVAASKSGLVERAASILPTAVSVLTKSSATKSAALDAASTTPKPGTSDAGRAAVGGGKPPKGPAFGDVGMPASSRTGRLPASSGGRSSGPTDRVLQIAAATVQPELGGGYAGAGSTPSSWSAASTDWSAASNDHLASGLPAAGESVMSSPDGRSGDPASRGSFRDQAVGGQDIVPRRTGAPAWSGGRREARGADQQADRAGEPVRAGSGGEPITMAGNRGGSGTGSTAQAATMVALHGDVMLDGRKMGRMVASGQTSAASLPTVSASAVNLRAMPVFTGTRIPL